MSIRSIPRLEARAVMAWAALFLVVTAIAQFTGQATARHLGSAVQFNSDAALLIGLAWTALQIIMHRHDAAECRRWWIAASAMGLLGLIQVTDWLVNAGVFADEWMLDLPLWAAVGALMWVALRRDQQRPWILHLWQAAVAFQVVFVLCHFCDGRTVGWLPLSSMEIDSMAEWSELLAIECHVAALALSALGFAPPAMRNGASGLGVEARHLYQCGHLFNHACYPPVRWAFYPVLHEALMVAACLALLVKAGPRVRRLSGRSLHAQFGEMLSLALKHDIDPLTYYLQELYRPGGLDEADFYLTRLETKNGLLSALNTLRAQPAGPSEMRDKVLFAQRCEQVGLSAVRTWFTCDARGVHWQIDRQALRGDLFCKPRAGRGARGVLAFQWLGHERYRAPDGQEIELDALIDRLARIGRRVPMIVQPQLRNHPEIADLADRSLIAIRVLTCLDERGEPIVTHGLLRILSKLEPAWSFRDEFASPIELHTGRLGPLVSDRVAEIERHSHHPVTRQRVEGRVLSQWPAISALAIEAHRAFSHRVFVGWDIASTVDTPVLLEGNTNLDVMFPQRAYRQGFGRGPLGPLLRQHFADLARARGVSAPSKKPASP